MSYIICSNCSLCVDLGGRFLLPLGHALATISRPCKCLAKGLLNGHGRAYWIHRPHFPLPAFKSKKQKRLPCFHSTGQSCFPSCLQAPPSLAKDTSLHVRAPEVTIGVIITKIVLIGPTDNNNGGNNTTNKSHELIITMRVMSFMS